MKLIIREYLASLKERGELDAVLPDLLSQLGLNVFSRPGRGTRQDGVDVGAVGKLDGKTTKVYLFSIKPGDLTRADWSGDKIQDLRPSLVEIIDAYIPNRLPAEYQDKEIVICLCVGGDILEQVRPSVEGFIKNHRTDKITFEQWNGDKLAALIQDKFLREDLLPVDSRSNLRKSLAMLDEPETSYTHFSALIKSLADVRKKKPAEQIRAIRQISICLWILFAWGREAGNLESPYRSSELAVLVGWRIVSFHSGKKTKAAASISQAFFSILTVYEQVSAEYLNKVAFPHTGKRDGLASAVRTTTSADVNLKLFDLLGRIAIKGLWAHWGMMRFGKNAEIATISQQVYFQCATAINEAVSNNPAFLSPLLDDQAIDISLAMYLLTLDTNNRVEMQRWLLEIVNRSAFAYQVHGHYPAILHSYYSILEHPKPDDEYRKNVTSGSILYSLIALWAAMFNFDDVYREVATIKTELLDHCNFQLWYPDEDSEENFYAYGDMHGAVLSHVSVDKPKEVLLEQVFDECTHLPHFEKLSAVKYGFWPILFIACRHYRLPLPVHFFKLLMPSAPTAHAKSDVSKGSSSS